MNTNNVVKKPHFVPRFYLERFVNKDGYVWTYDFQESQSFPSRPADTAVEKNFYGGDTDNLAAKAASQELENQFGKIESAAAPLFEMFDLGLVFRSEEREKMALFIALQHLRSPTVMHLGAEATGKVFQKIASFHVSNLELFKNSMDKYDSEKGIVTSNEDREKLRSFILDKDRYVIGIDKRSGLPALNILGELTQLFITLNWQIVEVTQQHLVTSDSPVVPVSDPSTHHPINGGGGFYNKSMYVTFPLSPNRMLEMFWHQPQTNEAVLKVNKQRGRLYNRQRAYNATRFMYSSENDNGIMKLGQKYEVGTGKARIVQDRDEAKVEIVRRLGTHKKS